jgi:hypothetical protein
MTLQTTQGLEDRESIRLNREYRATQFVSHGSAGRTGEALVGMTSTKAPSGREPLGRSQIRERTR